MRRTTTEIGRCDTGIPGGDSTQSGLLRSAPGAGDLMGKAGNLTEARMHLQKATESDDPAVRDAARKALR